MEKVNIKLSLEEINLILAALGKCPYEQVYHLVANLQTQAQAQLQSKVPANGQQEAVEKHVEAP